MDNSTIVRRFEAAKTDRKGSVEQLWDLIERFVLPFRGDFYATLTDENEVDWHRRDVYDSTAVFAAQALPASLQGNLTSPATQWFGLKFRDDDYNMDSAGREWLEACAKLIFEALQESNFNTEISEAYIDLVGFGFTTLTEEVDDTLVWDGLKFQAIPVREIYFDEDHEKQVRYLYRRLQMTAVQMEAQFGEDALPEAVKELLAGDKAATERKEVVFCIYPRKDKYVGDPYEVINPKDRPFGYKYVLVDGQETIGEEGGYYEMPAFVARWRKVAGSRWAFGPAAVALGDVLSANQLVEATFEAAGKVVDPVTFAEEAALITDLNMDRGALNVVANIDGIREHESKARFDVGNLQLDRLQESIRQAFYQDQLELKESPAMTATEVNVRYELMQRLLGPTLARLQDDLLNPLIQRTFRLMYRAGKLPELPEHLEGADLDVEYTGPLPRAQKRDIANAIRMWLSETAEMAEVYPELRDLLDLDEAWREVAMNIGVPAKVVKGETEVKKERQARQKQQQAMQGIETLRAGGEAAKAAGEGSAAVGADPNTIMRALAGGGGGN